MPRKLEPVGLLVLIGSVVCIVALLSQFGRATTGCCGRKRHTGMMIRSLGEALREYQTDYGAFPPSDRQDSSRPLVIYLDGDTTNGGPTKLYLDVKEGEIEGGLLLDPWGSPYHYRELRSRGLESAVRVYGKEGCPDAQRSRWNIRSFDLWSLGGDGGRICESVTNFSAD